MSKYTKHEYRKSGERPWKVHPIWRGIGCFLLIIVPIMAYAAAVLVAKVNDEYAWFRVPKELDRSVNLAQIYRVMPSLEQAIPGLGEISYLHIALTIGFVVVGFGLISVLYSILYSLTGAKHYSPVDAPPVRRSPHRKPR